MEHVEIDLHFLGREQAICCHRLGDLLVDPGPATCQDALIAALPDGFAPRAILLTHIHLDHAGATGSLIRRWPDAEVWVHERGARHMADPTRLLAGAGALYGDEMDRLWGEVAPVPEANIVALAGGETRAGFQIAYTPGHAKHHVSYFHEESGIAFVGDTAGIRVGGGGVLPPTPPSDIDFDRWRASGVAIGEWRAARLAYAHWGSAPDVEAHLAALDDVLTRMAALAAADDEPGFRTLVETIKQGDERYLAAVPGDTLWDGARGAFAR